VEPPQVPPPEEASPVPCAVGADILAPVLVSLRREQCWLELPGEFSSLFALSFLTRTPRLHPRSSFLGAAVGGSACLSRPERLARANPWPPR